MKLDDAYEPSATNIGSRMWRFMVTGLSTSQKNKKMSSSEKPEDILVDIR